MNDSSRLLILLLLLSALIMTGIGCGADEPSPFADDATAFVGATLWDGTGSAALENAALVVQNGRVETTIDLDEQALPEELNTVDLSGQYVIPGLINAHGHVGIADGLETGPEVHSEENVRDQLRRYAHYGVTTVVSLGDEPEEAFVVRDTQNPTDPQKARVRLAGPVLDPDTEDEAGEQVAELAEWDPDWAKIRVDDFLGQAEKMPESVYAAVIEAAHEHDLPLAAHIVELEDAKGVLEHNADLIAHSVRDEPVDDELIRRMEERDVCLTPTLAREVSTYIYAERPDFFDDPFFREHADEEVLDALQDPEVQAQFTGEAAEYYREALPLAKDNMVALHEAGIDIAMGTDSGPPARFQGYFEHKEMAMMQEAGLNPVPILESATRVAADCMGLDRVGTLEPGHWADFLVLDADPLEDIENLRELETVYLAGEQFE